MDPEKSPESNSSDNEEDMDAEKSPEISSSDSEEESTRSNLPEVITLVDDSSSSSDDCVIVDEVSKENAPRNIVTPATELWHSEGSYDLHSKEIKQEVIKTGSLDCLKKQSTQTETEGASTSYSEQSTQTETEGASTSYSEGLQQNENERASSPPGSQQNENERSSSPPNLLETSSSSEEDDSDEEGSEFFDSCFDDVSVDMDADDSNSDSSSEEEQMNDADANNYSSPNENNTGEPMDEEIMDVEVPGNSPSEDNNTVEPMDEEIMDVEVPGNSPSEDNNTVEPMDEEIMDEEVPEKTPSEDILPSEKFVWVKWSEKNYWPAIIIQPSDCGRESVKDNYAWVFWFGSHDISQVAMKKMASFVANFNKFFRRPCKSQLRAIEETIAILAKMSSKTINDTEELVPWAKAGFPGVDLHNDNCLTPILRKFLKQYVKKTDVAEEVEPRIYIFDEIQAGNLRIEDICVACYTKDVNMKKHPFFDAYVCEDCMEIISSTILAVGDDAKNLCCIVCGRPGSLVVCEQQNCSKSYCSRCLKSIAGIERTEEIMKISPWTCIFCLDDDIPIKKRINWEQELLTFLGQPNYYPKRPITVLSLFDGISTGKVVLEKLQISIKKYYASEVDPTAMTVSQFNHHGIEYLGDIRRITTRTFRNIEELDLVLAGPPCRDFSLANRKRKKLTSVSSNTLFVHLFRVLHIIKARYGHVFILIENVPMLKENKKEITAFLKMQPILVDAVYFSPQTRMRYFWGNIPGLECLAQFWNSIPTEAETKYVLQDFVDRIRDRIARGPTLRTVTCQPHSIRLKDGKLPILMDGLKSELSITELESIFGLPRHYTDAANISVAHRRRLIGQSWSVQVVSAILYPLKYFFS